MSQPKRLRNFARSKPALLQRATRRLDLPFTPPATSNNPNTNNPNNLNNSARSTQPTVQPTVQPINHPFESGVPTTPIAPTSTTPDRPWQGLTQDLTQDSPKNSPHPSPQDSTHDLPHSSAQMPTRKSARRKALTLTLVGAFAGLLLVGSGIGAGLMLLRLPSTPNCRSLFLPITSASHRLYCAQVFAKRNTIDDLLKAIALVSQLPDDHPLRPEINQRLEDWANALLDLAEADFHAGKLDEAIATTKRIPLDSIPPKARDQLRQTLDTRVREWQRIWQAAEKISQAVEAELKQQRWGAAFREVMKLLSIGNRYWETTRYEQYVKAVQLGRQDSGKLDRARGLADRDTLEDLLAAIKLLEGIPQNSPIYQKGRELLKQFGQQLLDLADRRLEADDLPGALAIARQVPESTGQKTKAQDFVTLARARFLAKRPTVINLENAIRQAQEITTNSPLYGDAQTWIGRWQAALGQVALLERARAIASTGSEADLQLAIEQVRQISEESVLWNQAQLEVDRWQNQLANEQDRPLLSRARDLASQGNLEGAIAEARRIEASRPLYDEAQRQIAIWEGSLSRQADQPTLDRARGLAQSGNLEAAIDVAESVPSGSPLYRDAQTDISSWMGQGIDRQNLDQAYELAAAETPDNLESAIRYAQNIPDNSPFFDEANRMVEQWSSTLLSIATERAISDPTTAIEIARRVPPQSRIYDTAEQQIASWEERLRTATPVTANP